MMKANFKKNKNNVAGRGIKSFLFACMQNDPPASIARIARPAASLVPIPKALNSVFCSFLPSLVSSILPLVRSASEASGLCLEGSEWGARKDALQDVFCLGINCAEPRHPYYSYMYLRHQHAGHSSFYLKLFSLYC